MAAPMWTEVAQALQENRRELLLNGPQIAERIARSGLDGAVYTLELLNYLEIADAALPALSEDVGKLVHLINLVLRGNRLSTLPSAVGSLKALRLLDISGNSIGELPDELGGASELHTLDASRNRLVRLPPSIGSLRNLSVLNVSDNQVESLEPLCAVDGGGGGLPHLSELLCVGNAVQVVPESISQLPALKRLDLSRNRIVEVPAALADCPKLKELAMAENPLRDRRLKKLISQARGTRATLDYVRAHGPRAAGSLPGTPTKSKKKGGRKKAASVGHGEEEDVDPADGLTLKVLAWKGLGGGGGGGGGGGAADVVAAEGVARVRPYIVCCALKGVDLRDAARFKKFITAQTKLHDGPLCAKRTKATIATHDLSLVKLPLSYEARAPSEIEIIPLGRSKAVAASALLSQLRKEADDMRKEAKRNTVSGIHKYLELLSGQERYASLCDRDGQVISFPPITNADITKISRSTQDILVEVTSNADLATCKKVMDALLQRTAEILSDATPDDDGNPGQDRMETAEGAGGQGSLVVEPVRVTGPDGSLRVVYPSRTDLQDLKDIRVVRSQVK